MLSPSARRNAAEREILAFNHVRQTIQSAKKEYPVYIPYTCMKVLHEQMIQEALERQHPDDEQATHRRGLSQAFRKVLARFTALGGWKQGRPLPGNALGQDCPPQPRGPGVPPLLRDREEWPLDFCSPIVNIHFDETRTDRHTETDHDASRVRVAQTDAIGVSGRAELCECLLVCTWQNEQ